MATPSLYTGPLGIDSDEFTQTLAKILTMEEDERRAARETETLRRSGDWETIQRRGFAGRQQDRAQQYDDYLRSVMGTSRGMPLGGPIEGYQERGRRLWQEQQAPRDREAQMQAMITSPGVNLPSLEEAYQLPQLRRDRQDARAEQLRAGLQEQQRLLAGASPGVVGLGLNEARAQQQQRQEQAQEEEGRRQFEFWSKAQSQDPLQQQLADFGEMRRQQERRLRYQGQEFSREGVVGASRMQREISERSAAGADLREALTRDRGSERMVQTPVGFERVVVPPQRNAMRQYLLDLEGEDEATKYRVAQALESDPVLRTEVLEAAAFNPADNVLKDYFDPATGILDALAVVGSALMEPVVHVNTGSKLLDTVLDVALSPGTWLTAAVAPGWTVGGRFLTRPLLRRAAAYGVETGIGAGAIAAGEATDSLPVGLGVALALGAIVVSPGTFMNAARAARHGGVVGGRATVRAGAASARAAAHVRPSATYDVLVDALAPLATIPPTIRRSAEAAWPPTQTVPAAGAQAAARAAAAGEQAVAAGERLAGAGGAAARGAPATIRRAVPTPAQAIAAGEQAVAAGAGAAAAGARGTGRLVESAAEATRRLGRDYAAVKETADAQHARYLYGRPGQLASAAESAASAAESAIGRIPMIRRVKPEPPPIAGAGVTTKVVEDLSPLTDEAFEAIVEARSATMPRGVAKLQTILESADLEKVNEAIEATKTKTLGVKVARMGKAQEAGDLELGRRQLAGELYPEEMRALDEGAIKGKLTEQDIKEIHSHINSAAFATAEDPRWSRTYAWEGFTALMEGRVPIKSRLEPLREALGDETVDALLKAREGFLSRLKDPKEGMRILGDLIEFPRAIMASTDSSILLRQGLPLTGRKFYRDHFKHLGAAVRSDDAARSLDLDLRAEPPDLGPEALKARKNVELLDNPGMRPGTGKDKHLAPEEFRSELADEFPGIKGLRFIRASNRAYVFSGNWLRMKYFDQVARELQKLPDTTQADYDNLARWVSVITGRGEIPKWVRQDLSEALGFDVINFATNAMFSPRFLTSRLQMLLAPLHPTFSPLGYLAPTRGPRVLTQFAPSAASKELRKNVAQDLVNYYTMWAGGLGIAYLAGLEVQPDPRHANFGVIKIGDLRLDLSAGQAGLIKTIAGLTTGTSIRTGTGEKMDRDFGRAIWGFGRAKLSPKAAFLVDVVTGETFSGEQITPERMAKSNLLPITVQELWEAIEEKGLLTGIALTPAVLTGVGAGVYTALGDMLELVAGEQGENVLTGEPLRFVELNDAQTDAVWDDPRVQDAFGDKRPIPLATRQRVQYDLAGTNIAKWEAEAETKLSASGFANGVPILELDKQKAILTDLMRRRSEEYASIFGDAEILAEMEKRSDEYFIEDMYALRFHSTQAATDPQSRIVDLAARDMERERILAEAIAAIKADPAAMSRLGELSEKLGMEVTPEQYVTGRGVGTFVGVQWENQVVADAMSRYRETVDRLHETDYYQRTKNAAWALVMRVNPDLQGQLDEFKKSYEKRRLMNVGGVLLKVPLQVPWRNEYQFWAEEQYHVLLERIQENEATKRDPLHLQQLQARSEASGVGGSEGIGAQYSRLKNKYEENWIHENPELAGLAASYGLIGYTKAEIDAILADARSSASAQPQGHPTMSLAGQGAN